MAISFGKTCWERIENNLSCEHARYIKGKYEMGWRWDVENSYLQTC